MALHMRWNDSIGEFVNAAVKRQDKTSRGVSGRNEDKGWAGGTWDQAVQWAKFGGWEPEMAADYRNAFDTLIPKLRKFTDHVVEARPDKGGFQVDVPAFLAGEPDHMWEWIPEELPTTKRAFCLLIGHSISASVSAEELFVRGQALIGLVRAFRLLGFDLEIWSEITVNGGSGNMYSILTCLQKAGATLDESAVEFAVGNPMWLRRLIFAYEEGESQELRRTFGFHDGGGYGYPTPLQHGSLVDADVELSLGSRWFYDSGSPERVVQSAAKWVVEQLVACGVVPEGVTLED